MHTTVVTHVVIAGTTLISAGRDGRLSFWHRDPNPSPPTTPPPTTLHFIKSFQAHRGVLTALHLTARRDMLLSTSAADSTLKLFSVSAFDMTHFTTLPGLPSTGLTSLQEPDRGVVALHDRPVLVVYVLHDLSRPPILVTAPNSVPARLLAFNSSFSALISCDGASVLDYAHVPSETAKQLRSLIDEDGAAPEARKLDCISSRPDFCDSDILPAFPATVPRTTFTSRLRTDLFVLARARAEATDIRVAPGGARFAVAASDGTVRVFDFTSGRIERAYDGRAARARVGGTSEGAERRLARDTACAADLESARRANVSWDESGEFVLYATVAGISVVHIRSNRVARVLGRDEAALRFLTVDIGRVENTASGPGTVGPLVVATAFDSERLFLFGSGPGLPDAAKRDVFNERPMARGTGRAVRDAARAEARAAVLALVGVTLHTSAGDIGIGFRADVAPRAVENFAGLARRGYYDGVVFHRVIRGFMVQTGDPDGDGTGGESMWGGFFEDELDTTLKHDEAGVVSMANAGPNTNGSVSYLGKVLMNCERDKKRRTDFSIMGV